MCALLPQQHSQLIRSLSDTVEPLMQPFCKCMSARLRFPRAESTPTTCRAHIADDMQGQTVLRRRCHTWSAKRSRQLSWELCRAPLLGMCLRSWRPRWTA